MRVIALFFIVYLSLLSAPLFCNAANNVDENNFIQGPPFTFSASSEEGFPNEVVCVDITVESFENVVSFQFGVEFDPTQLEFVNATSDLFPISEFFVALPSTGEPILTVSWGSLQGIPLSVSDGTEIFSICFNTIGEPATCSPITFTDPPSGVATGIATNGQEYGSGDMIFNDGEVCIIVAPLTLEVTAFDSDNNDNTGALEIELQGGVGPYTVSITECLNGMQVFGPSSSGTLLNVTNLGPGDYCIEVTDSNTPTSSGSAMANIGTCNTPNLIEFSFEDLICPGDLYEQVECLTEVATPPVNSFTWSNGVQTFSGNPISDVPPGLYNVTISDAIGCSTLETFELPALDLFQIDEDRTNASDPVCNGDNSGFLNLFVTGGTPPYTYTIDNGTQLTGAGNVVFDQLFAGSYTIEIEDANGCEIEERVFTLINPSIILETFEKTICPGESCEGYTIQGNYTDFFTTANGCDSIRTIILNVQTDTTIIGANICEGDDFEGYTEAGQYTNLLTSSFGCDSVVIINLGLLPLADSTLEASICEGEEYEGYTMNGTFEDVFISENGCDSTRTLILEVREHIELVLFDTICEGESLEGYSMTGTFEDVFAASNGCDSIRILNLTVLPENDPNCIMNDVTDLLLESLQISPNPAQDFIRIADHSNIFLAFELLDMHGRLIHRKENKQNSFFDLSAFPKGVYFIKAIHESGSVSQKFVKQ